LAILSAVSGLYCFWSCRNQAAKNADLTKGDSKAPGRALVRFSAGLIFLLFVSQLVQTLMTPQRLWDERAIFGIKAAILFEDQTINSPSLTDPDFVQYHPKYPLLIPLAEQHIYSLLGRVDDRWSKLIFPLMSLGLVLTFAGVLQRHIRASQAWLFALLLATTPILAFDDYGFLSGQADAPVACFHGIAVLYLWDWFRSQSTELGQNRTLILAAIAAAMTIFTKDEGIALFLVDAGMLALILLVVFRRFAFAIIQTAIFVTITVLLIAPWFWHRSELPATTEMTYANRFNIETMLEGMKTLAWSIPHMKNRMLMQAFTFGLTWWGLLLALVTKVRRVIRPEQLLLLGDVGGAIAALLVAGMIAPTPVEFHLGGSSHRFLMQLVPVGILFMAGQWGCDKLSKSSES
jgi:hypothetical protein